MSKLLDYITGAAAVGSTYYSYESSTTAKKSYKLTKEQIAKQTAEAKAQKERLTNLEKERKRKLIAAGEKVPETILTSPAGLRTQASIHHKTLLGQ